MNYYVYVYKDPLTLQPFYIGKGKGNRCYNHLKWKHTFKRVRDKITSLEKKGLAPQIDIVAGNLAEDKAYEIEEMLILRYGRKGLDCDGILMNICIGSRPPNYPTRDLLKTYYQLPTLELTSDLIEEVKLFLTNCESRKRYNVLLRNELGKHFIQATQHFPEKYSIPQRLYHIDNNLSEEPVCQYCGGKVNFKLLLTETYATGYSYAMFCSTSCRNKSEFAKEHRYIPTQEYRDRQRETSKRLYTEGKLGALFETNNPMKTETGKINWSLSRKRKKICVS